MRQLTGIFRRGKFWRGSVLSFELLFLEKEMASTRRYNSRELHKRDFSRLSALFWEPLFSKGITASYRAFPLLPVERESSFSPMRRIIPCERTVRKLEEQNIDSLTCMCSSTSRGSVITRVNHGNFVNKSSLSFENILKISFLSRDWLSFEEPGKPEVKLDCACYRLWKMMKWLEADSREGVHPSCYIFAIGRVLQL